MILCFFPGLSMINPLIQQWIVDFLDVVIGIYLSLGVMFGKSYFVISLDHLLDYDTQSFQLPNKKCCWVPILWNASIAGILGMLYGLQKM